MTDDPVYGPLEWEDAAFNAQEEWIKQNITRYAAEHANYGWFVDYTCMEYGTKVYHYGILTTDIRLHHTWENFRK